MSAKYMITQNNWSWTNQECS